MGSEKAVNNRAVEEAKTLTGDPRKTNNTRTPTLQDSRARKDPRIVEVVRLLARRAAERDFARLLRKTRSAEARRDDERTIQ